MVLLRMVSLVKDQQVDLIHPNKCVEQALVQYLCRADNSHVLLEVVLPRLLAPEVCAHGTVEVSHALIQVVAQDSRLLENQRDAVHLLQGQHVLPPLEVTVLTRKKAMRFGIPCARSLSSLCKTYLSNNTAIKVLPEPVYPS